MPPINVEQMFREMYVVPRDSRERNVVMVVDKLNTFDIHWWN